MTTFLVGTNRFEQCETLLAHRGAPVLRVKIEDDALVLDLNTPEGAKPLRIERNTVTSGKANIVRAKGLLSVIVDNALLLHAAWVGEREILVDLDLRPLGMAIHTDAAGLHIGGSTLAGNTVQGARVAIALS